MKFKPFGLQITEKEYRKLPYPSYSLLSDVEKEGVTVLNKAPEDLTLVEPIIIGSLVDKVLTDSANMPILYVVDSIPSDKPLLIIKDLIENINSLPNKEDILHKDNKKEIMFYCDRYAYFKDAAVRMKYLSAFKDFIKVYIDPFRDEDTSLIISKYQKEVADKLVASIKREFPYFNDKKGLGQVKLLGTINGTELKVMFDLILVDTKNKRLMPFDLKTGMDRYTFFKEGNYLKYNYYIQAALYKEVLKQNLVGTEFEDYRVDNFRILYCSKIDFMPVIFKITDKAHEEALNGFYSGTWYKKGLYELIEEFNFYKNNPLNAYRFEYIKTRGSKLLYEIDI